MVKPTQTIRWPLPTNCLSVLDHFMGLALKRLKILEFLKKNIVPNFSLAISQKMLRRPRKVGQVNNHVPDFDCSMFRNYRGLEL